MYPSATRRFRGALAAAALAVTALALSGCGSSEDTDTKATQATQAEAVTLTDGWVKAAESGMTAFFGDLDNEGTAAVHLVAVSSPVATSMEIHETVMDNGSMVMKQMEDGLRIAAGAQHQLRPGEDHLMVLGLTGPVKPGQEVELTLEFEDGSSKSFTVTAKDFTGADEEYVPSSGASGSADMDGMDGMDDMSGSSGS